MAALAEHYFPRQMRGKQCCVLSGGSYHDSVRVHHSMEAVSYGQHRALVELLSDGLLDE